MTKVGSKFSYQIPLIKDDLKCAASFLKALKKDEEANEKVELLVRDGLKGNDAAMITQVTEILQNLSKKKKKEDKERKKKKEEDTVGKS